MIKAARLNEMKQIVLFPQSPAHLLFRPEAVVEIVSFEGSVGVCSRKDHSQTKHHYVGCIM